MNKALIDTGILIRYLRGQRQAKELLERLDIEGYTLLISAITTMELYIGCREGTTDLVETEQFLNAFQIVEINMFVCKKAARLIKKYPTLFGAQVSRGTADALILASAWERETPLYTLNTRHFASAQISEIEIHAIDLRARRWT